MNQRIEIFICCSYNLKELRYLLPEIQSKISIVTRNIFIKSYLQMELIWEFINARTFETVQLGIGFEDNNGLYLRIMSHVFTCFF